MSDIIHKLAFLLERLPIAVALLDASGRVVGRAGYLSGVLGAGIPTPEAPYKGAWSFRDQDGVHLHPSLWPCARSLRGEYLPSGLIGSYENNGEHRIRVTSVPTSHLFDDVAAVSFLQQVDRRTRSAEGSHSDLEYRIIETLKTALHRDRPD